MSNQLLNTLSHKFMQSFPIRKSKCARKLFALVKVSACKNINRYNYKSKQYIEIGLNSIRVNTLSEEGRIDKEFFF